MAKRDIAVTSPTHAEGESSRPHLTDEGSEATPPRNDPPSTALFPEITEELDEFNTAREKDLSEESGDQQASSTREEVQIASLTATSSNPAPPKSQSVPLEVAGSESRRSENPSPVTDSLLLICHDEKDDSGEKTKDESKDQSEPVEKVQEGAEAEGVVSLGTSSEEISEKQGRKKRVMKKLGLGTSKRLKTSKSGAPKSSSLAQPNDESSSPALTQNASVSSRVRSRKASERSVAVEVSPVTKRVEQFLRRSIIAERSVDMTKKDQWGYVEIITKGSMGTTVSSLGNYVEPVVAEFYAGLPVTKVEADTEEIEVQVRGHSYNFSPTVINEVLNLEPLDEDEVDEETTLDGISKSELAEFLTEGTRKEWDNLTTADLSPRYGALMIIAAYNWIPSTHKTHVSIDRARLIYKMARGIRVDMGRLIFKQVMNLGVVQKNDSRWLIFPRLIMNILQKQHRISLLSGEKAQGPVVYTKDKRVGEIYEQRIAKAKGKAKKGREGKLSSRSTRMPPPMPASSIAPTPSNKTGPRCFSVHDLGSVSIPQGLLTQEDLQAVLQQTTRALQALTDIVQDLSRSVAGTCETQGLKRGRLKMYGQDGDVVVHEARHELRHQTRILELVESVNEHLRKIY
ncbi:hypothetical protein DY000_02061459 [Brassica cretica]|uniref:Putative plant transposon protein domain-containing protein n=1 Tax=Brassica cretica TaxID=69181 RepID=A0ABQ7APH8_BRACR|nr:hypothetical protein DY000_02061459 [Brassica cretica]